MYVRKLKSELIVKIQCVIILTKLDINKDFRTAGINPPQTEGAYRQPPFSFICCYNYAFVTKRTM